MHKVLFFSLIALLSSGCSLAPPVFSSVTTAFRKQEPVDPTLPITPRVLEQLPQDRYCEVQTVDPRVKYIGRIAGVEGDRLTLNEAERQVRDSTSTPWLANLSVPFLSGKGKNQHVVGDPLDGPHPLPRSEIMSVRILEEAEGDSFARRHAYALKLRDQVAMLRGAQGKDEQLAAK